MSKLDRAYFYPQVLQVIPGNNYTVFAYLNDGSIRHYDVRPLIKPDTVFWQLSDLNTFTSKLTVLNGTVAWDIGGCRDEYKCIDIDPETIFNESEVPDPIGD